MYYSHDLKFKGLQEQNTPRSHHVVLNRDFCRNRSRRRHHPTKNFLQSALRIDTDPKDSNYGAHCLDTKSAWFPLCSPLTWTASKEYGPVEVALSQESHAPYKLSPPWKVMLLSDGSVTRHLQLLTDMTIVVECLEQKDIGNDRVDLPELTKLIPGPLVQRQVLLHGGDPDDNRPYVYAASWWNAHTIDSYLKDKNQPIWVSLVKERAELYRELVQVEYGDSPYLEEKFNSSGPFWGRQYVFWHEKRPLTVIYEVFASSLQEYLGPFENL